MLPISVDGKISNYCISKRNFVSSHFDYFFYNNILVGFISNCDDSEANLCD